MKEAVSLILETVGKVFPNGLIPIGCVLGSLVLLRRKCSRTQKLLGLAGLAVLAVFFFPPTAMVLRRFMRKGAVYWRFLWLLPYLVIIPAAIAEAAECLKKKYAQILLGAALLSIFVLGGKCVYRSGVFQTPTSDDKLPQITMTTAAVINRHAEEVGNPYRRLMSPTEIRCQIRQFDATILSCTSRFLNGTEGDPDDPVVYFNLIIDGYSPDYKHKIVNYMRYNEANYLLTREEYQFAEDLEAAGIEKIYDLDGWQIWYSPDIVNTKYVIPQE